MSANPELAQRLATVHLAFGILCTLLALPYVAAGIETWWNATQFGAFGPLADSMKAAARNALVKGGLSALGAAYFFWRWRALRLGRR